MRYDILTISNLIKQNSTVLDLGCGDGELLNILKTKKNAKVKGIDIDEDKIFKCFEKGVPAYHGDMEEILPHYKNKSYDYVVLSLTLHQVKNPEKIIKEAIRVGKNVIISFPNFAHWKIRLNILFKGKLPTCDYSKYEWFSDKYVHFITVKDFEEFCLKSNIKIIEKKFFPETISKINPNFFSISAIYCVRGES